MTSSTVQTSRRSSSANGNWTLTAVRSALKLAGLVSARLAGRLVFSMMIRPRRREADLTARTAIPEPLRIRDDGHELQAYQWEGSVRALLVHGWDSSSADFSDLIPRLAEAGWGGLAYDGPAHGRSEGETTDFLRLGSTFRRIVRAHGPFDAVVSHSFGSAVVLDQLAQGEAPVPQSIVVGGAPASLAQVFSYYADQLDLAPEVARDLSRRIEGRLGRSADEIRLTESIRELEAEALIVHDHGDKYFPIDSARRLRDAAGEARLIETHGLGHRGWLKDQGILSAVIEFLSRSQSSVSPP